MNQKILPVLALVLAFLAGGFTGIWFQRHRPIAPPLFHPFEEFRGHAEWKERMRAALTSEKIAELNRRFQEIKPRIEEFQSKFNPIENDFRQKLTSLLTDEQKKRLPPMEPADWTFEFNPDRFLHPESKPPRSEHMVGKVFSIVIYQPYLTYLTKRLQLSAEQKQAVQNLLVERRARFLALVDEMPPPSMQMGAVMRETGILRPPPPPGEKPEQ